MQYYNKAALCHATKDYTHAIFGAKRFPWLTTPNT